MCNFREFHIYDMNYLHNEPEVVKLENLEKDYHRLKFLVETENDNIQHELEVSIKAGEIVGLLYDAFLKQYANPESAETLKSLNILCVRLVFCLFAEDADVFEHHAFHDYMAEFKAKDMRRALTELFKILDTKIEDRDPYLAVDTPRLAAFPYVDGGLFAHENIEIPPFTEELRTLLLRHSLQQFPVAEM